jgi:hypothetical protein
VWERSFGRYVGIHVGVCRREKAWERSFGSFVGTHVGVCRREKAWERSFGRYVGVGMVARRIKSQKETLIMGAQIHLICCVAWIIHTLVSRTSFHVELEARTKRA